MDKIVMLIIGILSLIIMYKIYNGGLVEGDIPDICRVKMDKVCEVERQVGFGTCSGCISPIAAQLLKDCKFDNFIEYCKNLPEPPPPPAPVKECVGEPLGTFCEDDAWTKDCWPRCPNPTLFPEEDVVKHCVGSYDKTSGKQCKYGWGYNYREGGTGFGCLSGDSCKHTVLPPGQPTPAEASFCELDNDKQAQLCLQQDIYSCTKYGEGCKWTSEQAVGAGIWGHPGIGNNIYPSCMVNCDACKRKPSTTNPLARRDWADSCPLSHTESECEKNYEVPAVGNSKLCLWNKTVASPGTQSQCLPDDNDRFCSRRRESKVCSAKDKDGYCYGTGDV